MPVRNHLRKEVLKGPASPLPPRHELKISGPLPHPLPVAFEAEHSPSLNTRFAYSPRNSHHVMQRSIQSTPSESRRTTYHSLSSPGVAESPQYHQGLVPSNASNASGMHRRRGSTLKTVMRKLFGRKPRDDLGELRRPREVIESYREQSPRPFSLRDEEDENDVSLPSRLHRSSSLPSLRQGSKVSIDEPTASFTALTPESQPWTSKFLEVQVHRRRATLPSVALSINDTLDLDSKLDAAGVIEGKAPATAVHGGSLDALTLKASNGDDRRRSRSACGLRDTAKAHAAHRMSPIQWRRRSDEIRFWRTSTLNDLAEPRPESRAQPSITLEEEIEEKNMEVIEEAPSPLIERTETNESVPTNAEVFNFKNLMETMQTDNDDSLAQRVGTLEVKLMDLEFAIAKLQSQNKSERAITKKKATISPARSRTIDPIDDSGQFVSSFISTPSSTPPRESPIETEATQHSCPNASCDHTSADNIQRSRRPPSPYHSDSGFQGISVEQYSALTTLMRREQCARKQLESQVLSMQEEIRRLQTGESWVPSSGSTFLRTSSPDSQKMSSSYPHESPRQGSSASWKHSHYSESARNDYYPSSHYRHNSDAKSQRTFQRTRNDNPVAYNNHIPGMI